MKPEGNILPCTPSFKSHQLSGKSTPKKSGCYSEPRSAEEPAFLGSTQAASEQQVPRRLCRLLMNKNDAACSPLCNLLQGNQSVAELLGATFEFVFHSFALTLFFCGKKTFVISFSGSDQMENDAGQFVGCRRDGHGGSMAGTHFSIVRA